MAGITVGRKWYSEWGWARTKPLRDKTVARLRGRYKSVITRKVRGGGYNIYVADPK